MSNESIYNKASSVFFFCGFLLSKIQYIPFVIASSITNLAALLLYTAGYGLWFLGIKGTPPNPKWLPFANFKEKFLYASVLGLLASTISILALVNPVFLIPAAWLYFASNVLWLRGEYYKLYHPPPGSTAEYIESQSHYFKYTITISTIGFITALSTTLAFFIPPITLPVILISSIFCVGLGCMAFEYWLESKFAKPDEDEMDIELMDLSHNTMNDGLGLSNQKTNTLDAEPYHEAAKGDRKEKQFKKEHPSDELSENTSSESDLSTCCLS